MLVVLGYQATGRVKRFFRPAVADGQNLSSNFYMIFTLYREFLWFPVTVRFWSFVLLGLHFNP